MVRVEWNERVVVVTIDRPERRNAVDHATLVALVEAQRAALEGGALVLVLTGAPPAFCSGADLTGVESGEFVDALVTALRGFAEMPIPTIAAIDGPALGAGTQLAIACDLRVASSTSTFGIPAAKLGLAVDHWTVERLAREFGWPIARAMLLSAQPYRTDQLIASGGIHRHGSLGDALTWAQEIAALAPLTISAHKLGLERSALPPAVDELYESARAAAWASNDAEEGRTAFLDKRRPHFQGH